MRVEVAGDAASCHVEVVQVLRAARAQRYLERTELHAEILAGGAHVVRLLVEAVDVDPEAGRGDGVGELGAGSHVVARNRVAPVDAARVAMAYLLRSGRDPESLPRPAQLGEPGGKRQHLLARADSRVGDRLRVVES